MSTNILSTPLVLPCGTVIPNRLAKAAMTERLADKNNHATESLVRLYRLWSAGGAGLLLTGNVQVDRWHLEAPGNMAIDGTEDVAALRRLAAAAVSAGNQCWMQISHAGRQTPKTVNPAPKAPSAVTVALPGGQFGKPVALTEEEIVALIGRFAQAAAVARQAGFTGVQIHAAHGYLISSFLSPRTNLRTDAWGGKLQNRARFLLETVARTRAAAGADFPISVKLNSADFQRGGFSATDSLQVAAWLDAAGVDLIEISGGSYEQPRMMKMAGLEPAEEPVMATSTQAREAYFQIFAPAMRGVVKRARLMVTGGFRTASGMAEAIAQDGVDLIGLGRPLCVDPDAPGKILRGECAVLDRWEDRLRLGPGLLGPASPVPIIKLVNGFGIQYWYYAQLRALAETGKARPELGLLSALVSGQRRDRAMAAALAR